MRESKASKEQIEKRRLMMEEHSTRLVRVNTQYQADLEKRMELRGSTSQHYSLTRGS